MEVTLEEILDAFLEKVQAGASPRVDEVIARYPAHASELQQLLPLLLEMEAVRDCSLPMTKGLELPLPFSLGDAYTLTRCLGWGGMGTVFEATQHPLQRRCSVKLLSRCVHVDDRRHQAFMEEARIIGMLHHRSIVKIYDAGRIDDYSYYAMEYIDGKGLDCTPIHSLQDVVTLSLEIAEALVYAHQCHVTHCDIKPSNLLLDKEGHIHISDFGLARVLQSEAHAPLAIGGTARYLAPECQTSKTFTPTSDQYAFGLTLYELLYAAQHHSTIDSSLSLQRLSNGALPSLKVPRDLLAIVQRCAALDPTRRYGSMEDVVEELKRYLGGYPVAARHRAWSSRLYLWAKREPLVALFVMTLISCVCSFVVILWQRYQNTQRVLNFANETLTQVVDFVATSTPSQTHTNLLENLLPYYDSLAQQQGFNLDQTQQAEVIIGLNALYTGQHQIAEKALRNQWEHHPSPAVGNALIDVLVAQERCVEANAIALAIVERFATAIDPKQCLDVIWALLRLNEVNGTSSITLARQLLQAISDSQRSHPSYQLAALLLLERDPSAIHLLANPMRIPSREEIEWQLATLASHHAMTPRYSLAFLNVVSTRLEALLDDSEMMHAINEEALRCCERALKRWPKYVEMHTTCVRFWAAYMRQQRTYHKTKPLPMEAIGIFQQLNNDDAMATFSEAARTALLEALIDEFEFAQRHQHHEYMQIIAQLLLNKIEHYQGPQKETFQKQLLKITRETRFLRSKHLPSLDY